MYTRAILHSTRSAWYSSDVGYGISTRLNIPGSRFNLIDVHRDILLHASLPAKHACCNSLTLTWIKRRYTPINRYVEELVRSEVSAGIPSNRIVVAGFSQGGAVALMMLRSKIKLGAVLGRWLGPSCSQANTYHACWRSTVSCIIHVPMTLDAPCVFSCLCFHASLRQACMLYNPCKHVRSHCKAMQ